MISCLIDFNFIASQFSFEKEETKAVFSYAALLNKMDRRHRITKLITNFYKLQENTKNYGNKVLINQNTDQ